MMLKVLLYAYMNDEERYGHYPQTVVADAGYGSEENYHLMQQLDCQAHVKYNRFHLEQRPR